MSPSQRSSGNPGQRRARGGGSQQPLLVTPLRAGEQQRAVLGAALEEGRLAVGEAYDDGAEQNYMLFLVAWLQSVRLSRYALDVLFILNYTRPALRAKHSS